MRKFIKQASHVTVVEVIAIIAIIVLVVGIGGSWAIIWSIRGSLL